MLSQNKLLASPAALCNMVRRIAIEAGDLTLEYFETCAAVEKKDDGSPVTLADQEAETLIHKALTDLLPNIPIIGEEASAAGKLPDLNAAEYFWLVDPLDGTREFIKGSPDYTVNIALIHKSEPVMGIVYAPALGVLYAAHGPETAVRWLADSNSEKQIFVRKPPREGLTVMASASHGNPGRLEKILEDFKVEKLMKRGSSLKICVIAEGKADLYPRLGTTCEWDTAAGDAVLRAAGGSIRDLQGELLRYGGANPEFHNPEFIASSFDWHSKAED